MENKKIAIKLKNVSKTFTLRNNFFESGNFLSVFKFLFTREKNIRKLEALKNINLTIYQGETLGIIGRNGSGKSTLVKIMSGAYIPDKGGIVRKNGKSILMSLRVGMNPELTARQNIYVNGSALGLRVKEIDRKLKKIVRFAEIEDFVDVKVKNFSNGMSAKLSFSIAINASASIMFLDEVFAVGDSSFRKKAINAIEKNWLEGRTVILVTHSMSLIEKYCDRAVYLKSGKIVFRGDPSKAVRLYNRASKIKVGDQIDDEYL